MTRGAVIALFGCIAFVSAALFAQDFSEITFDHLAKGLGHAEGPAWSPKDGFLIFSDTPGDKLWKWTPGSPIAVFR